MEDLKNVEPKIDNGTATQKAEEMIPQSQVGGIVAKETKQAIEKMLKDLGVEDVKSAKDGLSRLKEIQEAQKTEAEKIKEEADTYKAKYGEVMEQMKNTRIEVGVKEILGELNIDIKHTKTILKLADLSEVYGDELDTEKLKLAITKTLEDELPMLLSSDRLKIGGDKPSESLPKGSAVDYLDKKYANNPYYKK
jgi:hypothetical protein